MKKIGLFTLACLVILSVTGGPDTLAEREGKNIAKRYYQALIDEDFEKAFEQVYLYDADGNGHPSRMAYVRHGPRR